MKYDTLSSDSWRTDTAWNRTDVIRLETGHKIRVAVRRDEYDNQSSAVSKIHTGSSWEFLAELPFPMWNDSCKATPYSRADLSPVVNELIRRSVAIMGS